MKILLSFFCILLSIVVRQSSLISIEENPISRTLEVDNFRAQLNGLITGDGIAPLLEGEALVINLWATWCGPCIREIPKLNKLVEKYQDQGVRFLAFTDESKEVFEKFQIRRPSFEFRFEKSFANLEALRILMALDKKYHGRAIPVHILVKKDGTVKDAFVGGSKYDIRRLESFIKKEIKIKK